MKTAIQRAYDEYKNGMNEGGEGYNPYTAALAAKYADEDAKKEAAAQVRMAARQAATDAEWTLEVTVQRRAEWNTWVKSHGAARVHIAAITARIKEQGWHVEDLKAAIKRHGL
jgi:hypothetical protein